MPSQDNSAKRGSSGGGIGDSTAGNSSRRRGWASRMRIRRRAEVAAAQTGLVPAGSPVELELLRSAGEPKVSDEQRSDNLAEVWALLGCTTEVRAGAPQGVPACTLAGNAAARCGAQQAAAPGGGS